MPERSTFDKVIEFILKMEGGYVNNPHDPGGETKYGISKRSHPAEDIRNLTPDRAKEIYHDTYWREINGDSRPYPEALAIMDFAVNSGTPRALRVWNQAAGNVDQYISLRTEFLTSISTFNTFGRGWMRRIESLRQELRDNEPPLDVEILQLFIHDQTATFRPNAVSIGRSNSGRTKIMARL